MHIAFDCGCGCRLTAKEKNAGKQTQCPNCKLFITIPLQSQPLTNSGKHRFLPQELGTLNLPDNQQNTSAASLPQTDLSRWEKDEADKLAREKAERTVSKPGVLNWSYLFIPLLFLPMAFSSMLDTNIKVQDEVIKAINKLPDPKKKREALTKFEKVNKGEMHRKEVFAMLPGGKLEKAYLPFKTQNHYYFALASIIFFVFLLIGLFPKSDVSIYSLLTSFFTTAVIGLALLLLVQLIAMVAYYSKLMTTNPIIGIIYTIARFIGYSYHCAFDPEMGFVKSFVGFTFGVGLCEEMIKALPIIGYYRTGFATTWKESVVIGMASGVGFGVVESLHYSAEMYNGVMPVGIYLIRFVSCVALHMVWSGIVALFIHRFLYKDGENVKFGWLILYSLMGIAIPMVLHGLYNTLLKSQLDMIAFFVAMFSFAIFVGLVERARYMEKLVNYYLAKQEKHKEKWDAKFRDITKKGV